MADKEQTKVLATISDEQFALMVIDPEESGELLRDILGNERLGPTDLNRITIPGGGSTTWEIRDPSSPTGVLNTQEFQGITVMWKSTRTYWENPPEGGVTTPPTCASADGKTGVGVPGGDCEACPFACDFPSKCKPQRLVFVLRPKSILVDMLQLPRMSIKTFKQYTIGLGAAGIHPRSVLTSFTLSKETSGVNKYGVAHFTMVGPLSPAFAERVKQYAKDLKPALDRASAVADAETRSTITDSE